MCVHVWLCQERSKTIQPHHISQQEDVLSPSLYITPKCGSREPQMTHVDTSIPMIDAEKYNYKELVENSSTMLEQSITQWDTDWMYC